MQQNIPRPLPTEVHTHTPLSTRVRYPRRRRPRDYIHIDSLFPSDTSLSRRRLLSAGLAGIAALGVTALLLYGGWGKASLPGGSGGGLLGGIPSNRETTLQDTEEGTRKPVADETGMDQTTDTAYGTDTRPEEPADSESTSLPPEPPTLPAETEPATLPTESESVTDPTDGTEPLTESSSIPDTVPVEDTTIPPEPPSHETEPPRPTVPEGCFSIISADVSETLRGAGYIHNGGVTLPSALPTGSIWKAASPAVLIVNTQPYEGYWKGGAWYDPSEGGLAVADSPSDPHGVVALGTALARGLRDRGVTVIHLRLAVTAGESAAEIRERTEAAIRYYCRLYPDISLVIDLRRSAEMTEGGILRTDGRINGEACAQLRLSVSGGRDGETVSRDLAVALALREELWATDPTLSRPVRVKTGKGIVSELSDLRILTLEAGAAGNTFAEAKRAVEPLSKALAAILQNMC